jgi:hypothetical protein
MDIEGKILFYFKAVSQQLFEGLEEKNKKSVKRKDRPPG